MKTSLRLLLSVVPILFASCVVSENPLTDEDNSKPDPQLIGAWQQVKAGPPYVMTIGKKKDSPKVLHWVSLSLNKQKRVLIQKHNVFVAPGKTKLITIALRDDLNVIARYSIEKKTLKLHLLNAKFIGKAVDAGKLKGEARKKNGEYTSVALKDTAENLLKFVKQNATKCFNKKPVVFKKL